LFVAAATSFGVCLTTEAVQGAALALEGVHDVKSRDGLAASVLSVGHSVADHVLKEHLEHTTGLLVDEARDALDTTTARETADGRLRDALDVVTQHLSVALSTTLSKSLSTLSTSGHFLNCEGASHEKLEAFLVGPSLKKSVISSNRAKLALVNINSDFDVIKSNNDFLLTYLFKLEVGLLST